jgi:hypothetical protein
MFNKFDKSISWDSNRKELNVPHAAIGRRKLLLGSFHDLLERQQSTLARSVAFPFVPRPAHPFPITTFAPS